MAISLYAVTIPAYQQILGSVAGLLDKAEAFCAEKRLAHEDIIQARLASDMLPFAYQVKSTAVHSLGAIEGVRRRTFSPDMATPPATFAALKTRIGDTLAALGRIEPAEVDGFLGRDMRFVTGGAAARLHGRELSPVLLPAELLLPRDDGVRRSAVEGREPRQAGFHRTVPHKEVIPRAGSSCRGGGPLTPPS